MNEDTANFARELRDLGVISDSASLRPLTGGVSSDIYVVEDGDRRIVIKRALARLRVAAEWFADTSRNTAEQAYVRYVGTFRPDAVPELVYSAPERGFFAMEFLDGFANWKEDLLAGRFDATLAERAGALLGEIHARSRDDAEARRTFDTVKNFDQLRLDPYLRATADAHPELAPALRAEVERLAGTREALVHGDYSPKNMLHCGERFVIVDSETAWFGDPAFDLSFVLNHLLLKGVFHAPHTKAPSRLVAAIRESYRDANPAGADVVEERTARLLPMLALARVDGKSPVEYLTEEASKTFVRTFAHRWITGGSGSLDAVVRAWFDALGRGI